MSEAASTTPEPNGAPPQPPAEAQNSAPQQTVSQQAEPQGQDQIPAPPAPPQPPAQQPAAEQQAVTLPPAPPVPAPTPVPAPAPPTAETAPQASGPQHPQPPVPPAPAQPQASAAPAPAAPHPAAPAKPQSGISTFLKVSIILLAALSIAAISLVFIGDFEGKVERITATFLIFAVFVGLTAADTSRGQRNSWYAPVALIANSYILALLLIVTWMSEGGYFLGWEIFWKSVLVIGVTRAVVGCCQLLLGMGEGKPEALARFAFVTSVLAVLSGILFTAPLAIEVFDVTVPELYWKIAVAGLLLTALGLAITLLLRWSYRSQDRERLRQERQVQAAAQQQAAPIQQAAYVAAPPAFASQPIAAAPAPVLPAPAPQQAAAPQPQPGQPVLPWPTFADGRPLPVGPDGQPDFSVPGAPLPPQ